VEFNCENTVNLYVFIQFLCGGIFFNVNSFSVDSFTATHHASLTGSSEVVMGLIELECDVNAKDKKGDFCAYYRLRKYLNCDDQEQANLS